MELGALDMFSPNVGRLSPLFLGGKIDTDRAQFGSFEYSVGMRA